MNKSLSLLLLVVVAAVASTETETNDFAETKTENDSKAVSSFDALAAFYGKPQACYRCTSPCSNYQCCTGPYPQCCYISGLGCRCCSR